MKRIYRFQHFKESKILGLQFLPVQVGTNNLILEICRSHTDGLIGREIKRDGMIFIFNNPMNMSFHTKGCIESIDIVFVLNNRIVKIFSRCEPNSNTDFCCDMADTVLEFSSGTCDNLGIKVGIFCNI